MFEYLYLDTFRGRRTRKKHLAGPFADERIKFLSHMKSLGYTRPYLRVCAPVLLKIAGKTNLASSENIPKTELKSQISKICGGQTGSRYQTAIRIATDWLTYMDKLKSVDSENIEIVRDRFPLLTKYLDSRASENGFSEMSIVNMKRILSGFLLWLHRQETDLPNLTPSIVDNYLKDKGSSCSRRTMANYVSQLKLFLSYCEAVGCYRGSISKSLQGPRIYRLENLPRGPSWDTVKKLLAQPDLRTHAGIRDRAILLLLSVYGLRSSEVVNLKLEDIDWENHLLKVYRSKNRRHQVFPLTSEVGEAIVTYLKRVRPRTTCRAVFLGLRNPVRPLLPSSLGNVTTKYYREAKIKSLHQGPHSLRHSCATHLLNNDLSLKEIGDHLGHSGSRSTQTYTKVDLGGLRQVGEFGMGGLL